MILVCFEFNVMLIMCIYLNRSILTVYFSYIFHYLCLRMPTPEKIHTHEEAFEQTKLSMTQMRVLTLCSLNVIRAIEDKINALWQKV